MPKRSSLSPEEMALWPNLLEAFHKAAKGKQHRPDVRAFAARLPQELRQLQVQLLTSKLELPDYSTLILHDPKRRVIRVPSFQERVLQHAVLTPASAVLMRLQGPQSFACIPGRGIHDALRRAQIHSRGTPICVRTDIKKCYDTIDHGILFEMLERRFKYPGTLRLLGNLIARYESCPGKGLPIGTLFAQYMANLYLSAADRFLLEHLRVHRMIRYMDDMLWWAAEEAEAERQLESFRKWLSEALLLQLHDRSGVVQTRKGVPFLGAVVFPGRLHLQKRACRSYRRALQYWGSEDHYLREGEERCQQELTARSASMMHCDTRNWRRKLHKELFVVGAPESAAIA